MACFRKMMNMTVLFCFDLGKGSFCFWWLFWVKNGLYKLIFVVLVFKAKTNKKPLLVSALHPLGGGGAA